MGLSLITSPKWRDLEEFYLIPGKIKETEKYQKSVMDACWKPHEAIEEVKYGVC
jgi:hypothetical protein